MTSGTINSLLRVLFQAYPDPLLLLDVDGKVLTANEAFCLLAGVDERRLIGRELATICHACDTYHPLLPLTENWRGRVVLQNGGSEVSELEATVLSLRADGGGGKGFLLSARVPGGPPGRRDPTRTFQQQKLESLGVLASSVAHDLNNVLTGVLGHVSYLRLSLPQALTYQESVLAIEDGARKAASMTHQILEFARGEQLELNTVNLSLVVAAGLNLLRTSLPANVRVELKSHQEDIYVYGDEGQLSQLMMNLTINARDALADGGTISILLERSFFGDDQQIGNLELAAGEYAKLAIADNGAGIPAALQERVFEPFFTTKQQQGTGLGLATVHSIVKAHRGAITLESREGAGTCFRIYLPLSSDERSEKPSKPEAAELPTGTERILVVDDEEAVRTVIQRSLEHLGYEVVIAQNGREALGRYEEAPDGYALVILDMIMPQMPGDELFYKLRDIDSSVPVLIASGYSSDGRTKAILNDGALGFIQKPFAVEELALEVRRCIDAHRSR